MYFIMLSFIYFNFWHVHYTASIKAVVQNYHKVINSISVKFPCIYKQGLNIDEKHTFYMFLTFEAAMDQMEKYEFVGYFELIFISYIVLDIQ